MALSPLAEHPPFPAKPEQLAAPAPRKALSALARAAGSSGLEPLSLAGRHASAAPAGGNSLLTGRGRDKCPGTVQRPQSERRERGAPRESTGGGFGAIHEQRDKRCELDKLGMSGSSLPVSCSPCRRRSAFPGVKSLLVLKDG